MHTTNIEGIKYLSVIQSIQCIIIEVNAIVIVYSIFVWFVCKELLSHQIVCQTNCYLLVDCCSASVSVVTLLSLCCCSCHHKYQNDTKTQEY